ncbi:MAG: hypothetical protein IPL90_19565 [Holophagales bacterium]|nr:hypothetical protein [Holophagales bacterium]
MKDDLFALQDYNLWANKLLLESLAPLPHEEYVREMGGGWPRSAPRSSTSRGDPARGRSASTDATRRPCRVSRTFLRSPTPRGC